MSDWSCVVECSFGRQARRLDVISYVDVDMVLPTGQVEADGKPIRKVVKAGPRVSRGGAPRGDGSQRSSFRHAEERPGGGTKVRWKCCGFDVALGWQELDWLAQTLRSLGAPRVELVDVARIVSSTHRRTLGDS
jgi:hypothetical protein